MTHQHGGRPGSGTHGGGKGASGGGRSDIGSRNWEIAHGIDVGGKTSEFARGAGNGGSDNEGHGGVKGVSRKSTLSRVLKRLSKDRLRALIKSIYGNSDLGTQLMIENRAKVALRGEEEER